MEITRTKTTTYKITQVAIDFLEFNERFVQLRKNFKYQGFQCFNCRKKFEIGEKISLIFTGKGNKLVCKKCGTDIQEQLNKEVL